MRFKHHYETHHQKVFKNKIMGRETSPKCLKQDIQTLGKLKGMKMQSFQNVNPYINFEVEQENGNTSPSPSKFGQPT